LWQAGGGEFFTFETAIPGGPDCRVKHACLLPNATPINTIDVKCVDPKNKKRKKRVFYEKNKIRKNVK